MSHVGRRPLRTAPIVLGVFPLVVVAGALHLVPRG
jgi:hypothetical protein